jgi:hypothetical protein
LHPVGKKLQNDGYHCGDWVVLACELCAVLDVERVPALLRSFAGDKNIMNSVRAIMKRAMHAEKMLPLELV